jgi:hypothetical protein
MIRKTRHSPLLGIQLSDSRHFLFAFFGRPLAQGSFVSVFPRHPAVPMRTTSNGGRTSAPRPPARQTNRASKRESARFRL